MKERKRQENIKSQIRERVLPTGRNDTKGNLESKGTLAKGTMSPLVGAKP